MKKIAIAVAALLMGTMSASAADLAARPYTKAPVAPVAVYNWGGFYIGANGGWASSHKCWDFAGTVAAPLAVTVAEGCHERNRRRGRWPDRLQLAGSQLGVRSRSAG